MPSPFFKNKLNNPAPQDLSLQTQPDPDPIRIPEGESLSVTGITPDNITVETTPAGDLKKIIVHPNRARNSNNIDQPPVNTIPPEDNIVMDDRGRDIDSTFGISSINNSDQDSKPGLNTSPGDVVVIADSKDATSVNQGPFIEDLTQAEINPMPNELNSFGSYTYNIALYMINSKSYVDITSAPNNPQQVLQPPHSLLLMRSGGVGLDGSDAFFDDFYIDDLEISNIAVGPNKFKQNTNAVDIRFNITEPRGVTFIERLRDAAASVITSTKERYIHAPYLLEVSFKGYDENGRPLPAISKPKYIPIRITDIQFEVNTSGTQYKVQAIPFAHHTLGSVMSTIPFNIELKASTVGDIFSTGVTIIETVQTNVDENGVPLEERVQPFDPRAGTKNVIKKVKKETSSKNLAEILTGYQKKRTLPSKVLQEKNNEVVEKEIPPAAEQYDTYNFAIAQEIAQSKLNLTGLYDALNTPAPTEENKDGKDASADKKQFDAYVQSLGAGVTLDKETQVFKINAGTDITKLINLVIMHSDYMDKNIVDNPTQDMSDGEPISWFKIRPVIQSAKGNGSGYDAKDGRYKYNIKFAVEKNNIYYNDFPWAKKSKPVGNGVHKVYNYIYSGNNTEVLDFDLKFRTAFLQVMTSGSGSPFANKPADEILSPIVKELSQSLEGNTINSLDSLKRTRAKDLFSSVMSDGVDLVDLNLQIVGDPAYIPTSDAYWQDKVRSGRSYTTPFMPDGTINYNLSAPFIKVNLKTPTDYDETTGLANPNSYGNSSFSGIYQVSSVDSTFSGGMFQQRVYGFRTGLQNTRNGLARSETQTAGKERKEFINDSSQQNVQTNGIDRKVVNSAATVINPADANDGFIDIIQDTPYTNLQVNTERNRLVAQQADQSVLTIDNTESDVTAAEAWASSYPGNRENR
jgi:hypothetical protein